MLSRAANFALALYQRLISPAVHLLFGPGHGCRFTPSCSEYAREAIAAHGSIRGSFFAVKRILRCHPFSRGGYDPVLGNPHGS